MAHPTIKGQKYTSGGKTLTAKAFHGKDGVFYETFSECRKARLKDKMICVVNVEHGGSTDVNRTDVVA